MPFIRKSALFTVIGCFALLLSGCGGPEKNYPHLADLAGTYTGQTNVIGKVSLTISQDDEGYLRFTTSFGYSGKLDVTEAKGEAGGESRYNETTSTRYTLKAVETEFEGRAKRESIHLGIIEIYKYYPGKGPYGYTAALDAVLGPWGVGIDLTR